MTLAQIQTILKNYGFYFGVIDSDIGNGSYSAFLSLQFQKDDPNVLRKKKIDAAKAIQNILKLQSTYAGASDGQIGPKSIAAFNDLLPLPRITSEQLQKIYPGCKNGFSNFINQYADEFGLKTKAELCAFLANALHESSGFKNLRESLNYTPARLLEVFPRYVRSLTTAKIIVSKGQVYIGDIVYGGRMGNGHLNGDGYKYRGGGFFHTTGKYNYTQTSHELGLGDTLITNPEKITETEVAVKSAFWFWKDKDCSDPAKTGNFHLVCERINGGTNGLKERLALHAKCWNFIK